MKKRTIIFACALLFAVVAQAQWDLEGVTVDKSKWVDFAPTWNPDSYIMTPGAGSIGSVRQNTKFSKGKGPLKVPQKAGETTDLPDHWDNGKTKYFPPVFNQAGGSCGVSSRAGYMLCEELNAYRGTDASHPDNRLAPNVQHPFDNTGPNKNMMAYQIGFPSVSTYGGFPYSDLIGFYGPTSDNAGWMQGYDKWYKTMHNRIWGASNIPIPVIGYPEDNPDDWGLGGFGPGALAAKRWLYNHNGDESFHTGGLLGLGVSSGYNLIKIPNTAENRKNGLTNMVYWVPGSSVDHAVTMCGYDDRIEFDLDGNGKVGERKNSDGYDEKGAWIIVNSWGNWGNNGFVYVPYALAAPTTKKNASGKGYLPVGSGFTPEMWHIRKDYTPARTIKLKISFTQRSAISLKAGISTNLKASSPSKTLLFENFNYKGDGNNDGGNPKDAMTPMLGKWVDGMHYEPMEFGFDLTDLMADFDPTQPLKFFFIIESKSTATGVGGIHEASIIDYTCNPNGVETPFVIEGDSVNIGNKGRKTTISTIVYGEAINAPTNLKTSGTTLSWDAPQTTFTPVGYIIYQNGTEIARTEGNVTSYNIGAGEGTYTVKTIYEFGGQQKLSGASVAVEGNYSFSKRYITKVGTAITKLADLKDGMTVIIYNTGRGKYLCDTGVGNYQHKAAAPKKGDPNSCEYIFTVHKVGNAYTFTSENGSLPAFEENNVGIPVSSTPGQFTVTVSSSNFLLKNGSWYLNGNENIPVTWNAGDNNSRHRITPVECDAEIQGLEDYTTVTTDNLMEGQIVALYNNGRGYFITDENGSYGASASEPTGQSYNYLFRVGKNADGTFTFTSQNGAIPALPYNTTFAPGNTAENFTLTSAGTGLFYLQGATAVTSAGGQQERQYLNGNETAPIGWNSTGENSVYRLYPVKTSTTAPTITIVASTPIQALTPVQLSLTGDADIASCVWTVEGKTYTSISPTVIFTSEGSVTVECTAVNMRGMSKTATKMLTVNPAPALEPSADFTVSKEKIVGGEAVSFLATNQLAGCSYHWNLPGTQQLTAETRNASVVYLTVGEHQVTLTVTAPDGTKKTNTQTVTVHQVAPAPAFSLPNAVILKGESVTFTDETLYNPLAWSWILAEEKNIRYQSTDQNPTFTPAPGRYELQLKAANEVGNSTFTRKNALLVCNAPSYTGLEFAGGNDRVTANLPAGITNTWTIDFWLNPMTLEEVCAGIYGSNLSIRANSDGAVSITREANGNKTTLATSANAYYVAGEWHHYAISCGGGFITFYRDGVELCRTSRSSTIDFSSNFTTIQIGGADAPFEGMIDEFRVWGTVLPVGKIRTYAVAPIEDVAAAVQNDGLLLYYQFNQNTGNCIDATSYGNEGVRHDFGPDGDAWSDSRGVFAINLDGGSEMVGGMLNQTFYRVIDTTDGDVSNVVDGKDATMWQAENVGYPLSITLDRGKLDEIRALRFYSSRGNDAAYLPTTLNIYESDDASTWTTVLTNAPVVFGDNLGDVMLSDPITRRYVKIEFPTGGTHLALNEIFFFGKDGEVIDNEDGRSDSGYTVTWRIYDKAGTELWKIYKQTNVASGTKITKLPDTYRIKGCTYSAASATVESDTTLSVNCTWPTSMFTPSTPENPVYHSVQVNGKYARYDIGTQKVTLKTDKVATTEEIGKWAFFGNPYAGYLVVNAAEPRVFLSCQPLDKSYSALDAGGTRFNSRKSDNTNSGGFLLQVILNDSYLNDYGNEGLLATWADTRAVSSAGSAFKATKFSSETNGIETIDNNREPITNNQYYTIGGVKLNGKPTEKGIYIINGRKVVVK